MRDIDVRRTLLVSLEEQHHSDGSRIVEELGIANGRRRVDVAVINGELIGYEIKSAVDDLTRLPGQADLYGRLFDRVCIVAAERHLDHVDALIPGWWGIQAATADAHDRVELSPLRAAEVNPSGTDPLTTAKLLWRDEALALLDAYELGDAELRRGSRLRMYRVLAAEVPHGLLREHVRSVLTLRQDWR